MKTIRLIALLFVTGFVATLSAWAADPNGVWSWTVTGRNGQSLKTTLTLNWSGEQLTGTIDNRAGKIAIREASFSDDQLAFTVVRKFRRRKITVKYAGKLDGDTISGTIETTGRDNNPVSIPWEAHREK